MQFPRLETNYRPTVIGDSYIVMQSVLSEQKRKIDDLKKKRAEENMLNVMKSLTEIKPMDIIFTMYNQVINPQDIIGVYFNDKKMTTVIKWKDGTMTKVKAQSNKGDIYNPEMGMAMCICKKALGNKGNFNEVFKKWLPEEH